MDMNLNEPRPTFAACSECGEAVHRDEWDGHRCDEARQLELLVRRELAAFEPELGAWLGTPGGQFAVWLAERQRP
jgi:hypothetical protein